MNRPKYILLLAMAAALPLWGQSDPCPGFRNPMSFNTGSSMYFWSARVGERVSASQSSDTTTGYYIKSTCAAPNCPDITGHANITSTTYNTESDAGITCCNHGNLWDANGRRFQIITMENGGIDEFTVSSPGTGMPRIPPGYNSSIRLGDPRASYGSSPSSVTWSSSHSNKGAEALFYTMRVTSENALLVFNYAVVGRCYDHSTYQAGEFLIRIVARQETEDANGNITYSWPNQPINDSLWFKVSAPAIPSSNVPAYPWTVGRPGSSCGSTTCAYVYKPWAKVAVSLSKYLYKTIRIEMYTSDCIYNVDPIYAYICGDYASMRINSVGCADAQSSAIDTLIAPEGLLSYTWYACENGSQGDMALNDAFMETVPFRQISEPSTDTRFVPQLADFVIANGDTVSQQTFMCVMTSALDPAKPITSKLYANVENGKPNPFAAITPDCDLNVAFRNQSVTYGNHIIDTDSTRWVVYSDTLCSSVLDTLWGENVSYRFPTDGYYKVAMRVKVFGRECGSEKTFVCRALQAHEETIALSEELLCDGESVSASCTRFCHLDKVWQLETGETFRGVDTISWTPAVGVSTVSLTTTTDSLCPATAVATVKVLGNTTITSDVDASIICKGDSVVLNAAGVESPHWYSSPNDPSLDGQQGNTSVVVTPYTTTTYTATPAQTNRCMQNESNITIIVLQYPIPTIGTSKPYVDITDPTLHLDDRSPYGNSSRWTFSDGTVMEGARVSHQFGVDGDSVSITLHTCNEERCCADTTITLPVQVNAVWIPNTFTPDQPNNSRFSFIFTIPIVKFEIWIYDRQGRLVYNSNDLDFSWDGRTGDGVPCPQGAYVYFYRYANQMEPDRNLTGDGTVLILR